MKLLHLDTSALGANSVTRELSAAIVARWKAAVPNLSVDYRDLDANPLPHITGAELTGADAALRAEGDATMAQFLDSDVIVIGAPMYNFGIASTLKAWIDRVAVAGKTFRYNDQGQPEGLAGNKRVIVASGRGGVHGNGASDFQENYLRFVLGFLGITDVEFVRAEGVAYSPQHRTDAMASAHASIPEPIREAA
jgi:FMN-dependent NADH-azoreductase